MTSTSQFGASDVSGRSGWKTNAGGLWDYVLQPSPSVEVALQRDPAALRLCNVLVTGFAQASEGMRCACHKLTHGGGGVVKFQWAFLATQGAAFSLPL